MSETVAIPGGRDVRGSLDAPESRGIDAPEGADAPEDGGAEASESADACVVACPPHPQMGGSRSDRRLVAVSEALVEAGVACLRFDYGPWDEGRGEQTDAADAVAWAAERYARVGLFGYSFGAAVALLVAADRSDLRAVSVLAPPATLGSDRDVAAALEAVSCPVQVVFGERDDTVDWEPVVDRARDRGHRVDAHEADHHFVGQHGAVASSVGEFLTGALSTGE